MKYSKCIPTWNTRMCVCHETATCSFSYDYRPRPWRCRTTKIAADWHYLRLPSRILALLLLSSHAPIVCVNPLWHRTQIRSFPAQHSCRSTRLPNWSWLNLPPSIVDLKQVPASCAIIRCRWKACLQQTCWREEGNYKLALINLLVPDPTDSRTGLARAVHVAVYPAQRGRKIDTQRLERHSACVRALRCIQDCMNTWKGERGRSRH